MEFKKLTKIFHQQYIEKKYFRKFIFWFLVLGVKTKNLILVSQRYFYVLANSWMKQD